MGEEVLIQVEADFKDLLDKLKILYEASNLNFEEGIKDILRDDFDFTID